MATVGVHYGRTSEGKMFLTHDQFLNKWGKLTQTQKLGVLWEALDYMSQSNTRTKTQCIAMAMGYKIDYVDIKGKETEVYIK